MVRSLVDWITAPREVLNVIVTRLESCVPVIVGWLPRRPVPSALPRLQRCVAKFANRIILEMNTYTDLEVLRYSNKELAISLLGQ